LKTAVLLVDAGRAQSAAAVLIASEFFSLRQVQRHTRSDKKLREPCEKAAVLLNFLSAPYVPQQELDKFWLAVNFHPAPPAYPGVGAASLALYDMCKTYGVTAHRMTDKYDAGQILRVRSFSIDNSWGYKALWDRALRESLAMFIDMCQAIAEEQPLQTYYGGWSGPAMTRKQFERHPSFVEVPK